MACAICVLPGQKGYFMRFRSLLKKLAMADGVHPRFLHAALIAKGKSVFGMGTNIGYKHAEVNAIEHARTSRPDLAGATLYTLMVRSRSGSLGNGSPCQECMDAIASAGIRKVVVYL